MASALSDDQRAELYQDSLIKWYHQLNAGCQEDLSTPLIEQFLRTARELLNHQPSEVGYVSIYAAREQQPPLSLLEHLVGQLSAKCQEGLLERYYQNRKQPKSASSQENDCEEQLRLLLKANWSKPA